MVQYAQGAASRHPEVEGIIPFCVSEDYRAKHNDGTFFEGSGAPSSSDADHWGPDVSGQDDVSCSLTGKFWDGHETTKDQFLFMIDPNGIPHKERC